MKKLIYVLLYLMCSCSAKQKWLESNSSSKRLSTEREVLAVKKQNSKSLYFSLDSGKQTNWLKIYPKDVFVFNNNGFQGAADSLIWYGSGSRMHSEEVLSQRNEKEWRNDTMKNTELFSAEERKKSLWKFGFSFWWVIAGVLVLVGLLLYCSRIFMASRGF